MQVVLNVIYFFLALTVLVSIHEAGHLTMAKLFNVYCEEYSIGFGPVIYQHKPKGVDKNGKKKETKFSIRCLPLGGYVSMAGEGMQDMEQFKDLPKERFLNGIAKWKRAIIMIAGVTLNAILGLILLITAFSIMPTTKVTNTVDVTEKLSYTYVDESGNSLTKEYTGSAFEKGLTATTQYKSIKLVYEGNVYNAKSETLTGTNQKVFTIKEVPQEGEYSTATFMNDDFNAYYPSDASAKKSYVFTLMDDSEVTLSVNPYLASKSTNMETGEVTRTYRWEYVGISTPQRQRNFGEVMSTSFSTFGEYSIALFKALGSLFTKEGISSMGGPVAIVQQQMTFAAAGFGQFLLFWGLISINLAIINLLPFPGLDGWHLVVVCVEGITRKEINPKVKSIMSAIGLILLFGLMIAITIKDIIGLF